MKKKGWELRPLSSREDVAGVRLATTSLMVSTAREAVKPTTYLPTCLIVLSPHVLAFNILSCELRYLRHLRDGGAPVRNGGGGAVGTYSTESTIG